MELVGLTEKSRQLTPLVFYKFDDLQRSLGCHLLPVLNRLFILGFDFTRPQGTPRERWIFFEGLSPANKFAAEVPSFSFF